MKVGNIVKIRRFFRRFNLWLFLVCVLLAAVIWCVTSYLSYQSALETADVAVRAIASTL